MTGRVFLRSAKALVRATVSDSFRFRRLFRFFAGADYMQASARAYPKILDLGPGGIYARRILL